MLMMIRREAVGARVVILTNIVGTMTSANSWLCAERRSRRSFTTGFALRWSQIQTLSRLVFLLLLPGMLHLRMTLFPVLLRLRLMMGKTTTQGGGYNTCLWRKTQAVDGFAWLVRQESLSVSIPEVYTVFLWLVSPSAHSLGIIKKDFLESFCRALVPSSGLLLTKGLSLAPIYTKYQKLSKVLSISRNVHQSTVYSPSPQVRHSSPKSDDADVAQEYDGST
jgi:hypothetical protein